MRDFTARWMWLAISGMMVFPALGGLAAPSQHHRHPTGHRRHHISAAEARAARVKRSQLGHKLHLLHSHMHQLKAKIHSAKAQEHVVRESIQTVEARLARTRHNLARINSRLAELTTQHVAVVQRLDETQRRLALRRQLLATRIRDNYERGQATYAHVLLESRSVHELLSRGYYVRQIVHSDTELIQGVRRDVAQIEADKRLLEAQAREQKILAAQCEAEKQAYAADLERKQEFLQNVEEERAKAQQDLDDLESEAEAWTARIRTLTELLERRRQDAQREARTFPHHQRAHTPNGDEEGAPVWRGGFIRPCEGPVTSGFGNRFHPILHRWKMHTGIDFGAPYGAPIRAAAGGTVLFAGYTRGYGNLVVLYHGNGVTTLYGHCSALLVSADQRVSQGQVIARVGATGLATGPHLHFELRHNGVAVHP